MRTGFGTYHLPEIWVFSQQFWLSYDFVVACLRRTVNVKKCDAWSQLDTSIKSPTFFIVGNVLRFFVEEIVIVAGNTEGGHCGFGGGAWRLCASSRPGPQAFSSTFVTVFLCCKETSRFGAGVWTGRLAEENVVVGDNGPKPGLDSVALAGVGFEAGAGHFWFLGMWTMNNLVNGVP